MSNITIESLYAVLVATFSPDSAVRKPAEASIKTLKQYAGSLPLLLRLSSQSTSLNGQPVDVNVRKASAIQAKNLVRETWMTGESDGNGSTVVVPAAEKESIRQTIVCSLLVETETVCTSLFAETINLIAIHDYPQNWQNLLPTLIQSITEGGLSGNSRQVNNALIALRTLAKRYEYKKRDSRGPLDEIVKKTFPLLLSLIQNLLSTKNYSLESALMMKQCLKIFWSCTQFFLSNDFTMSSIAPWFEIFRQMMQLKLPEASENVPPYNQPVDIDERDAWPWWKLKKWAIRIMHRIFERYGTPALANDDVPGALEFATAFSNEVAPVFMGAVCETLSLKTENRYCYVKVTQLCLLYVCHAVELKSTYSLLKPHLPFLVYQVCFPLICLSPEDVDMFENDPHEFIQRANDFMMEFPVARTSALGLVHALFKLRSKDIAKKLIEFLATIVQQYYSTPVESRDHIKFDGALNLLGTLNEELKKKKAFHQQLVAMISDTVVPAFDSPVSFVRCRACWMVNCFYDVEFNDDGALIRRIIQSVFSRLADPSLPTQIEASKALRNLIGREGAKETLLPVLPQILSEYFRILNEIGSDEVVDALETLIEVFGEHISPHATQLIQQLANTFKKYCSTDENDDDEAFDEASAALQCLECIATVLHGVSDTEQKEPIYASVEPTIVELICFILSNNEYLEFMDNALDLLTCLTYYPEKISEAMWTCFPAIYTSFNNGAFDYITSMVDPIDNLIEKSPEMFLALKDANGTRFLDLAVSIVKKVLENDAADEVECRKSLVILASILINCKGAVDEYLPIANHLLLTKLETTSKDQIPLTRVSIFQVLGCAFFYNAELQMQEFEKRNNNNVLMGGVVMEAWYRDISDISKKWLATKCTIIGWLGMLSLGTERLRRNGIEVEKLISSVIELSKKFQDDFCNDEDDGAVGGGDDMGDWGVGDGNEEDDDGALWAEADDFDEVTDIVDKQNEELKGLKEFLNDGIEEVGINPNGGGYYAWGVDEDEDDANDYHKVIGDVQELQLLEEVLTQANNREPQVYAEMQARLGGEVMGVFVKLCEMAKDERERGAQKLK